MADAGSIDSSSFDNQINTLLNLTKDINLEDIPIIHVYNSAGLLLHSKLKIANAVRLGICMYGINPVKHKEPDFKLRPTFNLYSEIMETKQIKKGEYIGYNNNYQAKRDMKIGIVPIGYADGVSKNNTGRNISINGSRYKIINGIDMDMLTVYIDDEIKVHDKVALIGEIISIKEVAEYILVTEYEVMTSISNTIIRKHIKNDKQIN